MKKYEIGKTMNCPKCGHTSIPVARYVKIYTPKEGNYEHINIICRNCGYSERRLPLDVEATELKEGVVGKTKKHAKG